MDWQDLSSDHVLVLRALERSLNIRRLANVSELPYTTAVRRLREISRKFSLRLLLRFEKLDLVPLAVLSKAEVSPPPFTTLKVAASGVESFTVYAGLVPAGYAERFVRDAGGGVVVRGLELLYWTPSSLAGGGPFDPSSPDLLALPAEPAPAGKAPDAVDLALLSYKLNSPFMRASAAYGRALAAGGGLPELTRHAVAYHWRRHVLPYAVGARAYPVRSDEPLLIFYLEGWRSHAAARALRGLPGFRFALVDRGRSLVFAQLDARQRSELYAVVRSVGARLPIGELISEKIEHYRPHLWECVVRRSWLYKPTGSRVTKPFFP